jgi:hypothetical protein
VENLGCDSDAVSGPETAQLGNLGNIRELAKMLQNSGV